MAGRLFIAAPLAVLYTFLSVRHGSFVVWGGELWIAVQFLFGALLFLSGAITAALAAVVTLAAIESAAAVLGDLERGRMAIGRNAGKPQMSRRVQLAGAATITFSVLIPEIWLIVSTVGDAM